MYVCTMYMHDDHDVCLTHSHSHQPSLKVNVYCQSHKSSHHGPTGAHAVANSSTRPTSPVWDEQMCSSSLHGFGKLLLQPGKVQTCSAMAVHVGASGHLIGTWLRNGGRRRFCRFPCKSKRNRCVLVWQFISLLDPSSVEFIKVIQYYTVHGRMPIVKLWQEDVHSTWPSTWPVALLLLSCNLSRRSLDTLVKGLSSDDKQTSAHAIERADRYMDTQQGFNRTVVNRSTSSGVGVSSVARYIYIYC